MLLTIALALGLGLTQILAQRVSGGVKVDANMSSFFLDNIPDMKSKLGLGVSLGGFSEIALFGGHSAFRTELLLHYKNSTMEERATGNEKYFQYIGVELSHYYMIQRSFPNGRLFVGVGPYVGFGIDARYKFRDMDDVNLYKEYNGQKSEMRRWNLGGAIMVGYEFNNKIQVTFAHKRSGIVNLLQNADNRAGMFNQAVSLGVGYRF